MRGELRHLGRTLQSSYEEIFPSIPAESASDPYLKGYAAGYAAAMRQDQPEPEIHSGDLVMVTKGPKAGMTGYAQWTEYAGQQQLRFVHYGSKELWYIPEGGLQRIFP